MSKKAVSILIDEEIKRKAEDLFLALGLDLSTAVSIFLSQSLYENGIPFRVGQNMPNRETLKAFAEGDMLESSPNTKCYDDVEELLKDLKDDE